MNAEKILIVEDEAAQARFLADALESFGFADVAIAGSFEEALAHAAAGGIRLALVDINLDGAIDGVGVATRLREHGLAIVYVTGMPDHASMERAMRTSPSGYLLKPVRVPELRAAIEIALHHQQRRDAPKQSDAEPAPSHMLSRREVDVLRLLAVGHTAKEVAARLGIAKPTVETYRARISDKLGVTSRAELVAFAMRMGLGMQGDVQS